MCEVLPFGNKKPPCFVLLLQHYYQNHEPLSAARVWEDGAQTPQIKSGPAQCPNHQDEGIVTDNNILRRTVIYDTQIWQFIGRYSVRGQGNHSLVVFLFEEEHRDKVVASEDIGRKLFEEDACQRLCFRQRSGCYFLISNSPGEKQFLKMI
jgi:hypothetical protein